MAEPHEHIGAEPGTVARRVVARLRRLARRLRPRSVRARATLGASVVVALALGLASAGLLGLLENNLLRNAQTDAERQAVLTAGLAAEGRLDAVLAPDRGTDFLQVVDAHGRVLAASPNLTGRPALSAARPSAPGTVRGTWNGRPVREEHRQRVVQVTTATGSGLVTVYAGTSLREADAADEFIRAALIFAVPLLVLTVALVTWRVTGWALRPVEAIRAEVAEISDRDLHRRVPVPPSQDEIARLAATMNTTLDRLEASVTRQRQFIADASHELRSPITVLRTQLEVAQAHPDPDLWSELLSGALEDTVRLQDLASDSVAARPARHRAGAPLRRGRPHGSRPGGGPCAQGGPGPGRHRDRRARSPCAEARCGSPGSSPICWTTHNATPTTGSCSP